MKIKLKEAENLRIKLIESLNTSPAQVCTVDVLISDTYGHVVELWPDDGTLSTLALRRMFSITKRKYNSFISVKNNGICDVPVVRIYRPGNN